MQFGGVEEEKATKQEGKETVNSLWHQQKTAEQTIGWIQDSGPG